MGCLSLILEQSGKFKSVFPYSFEPMAYLSLCFLITFWGFIGFKDQKFSSIKIENIYFYQVLEIFLLIGGLLAILFFLPFAYGGLTGDIALNRIALQYLAESKLGSFGIVNSIFTLLANLFILNQLCSFINLIPRNGKRNVFKASLMFISSFSYVVYILAYVGRDGIVFWLMSYIFCYLLFRDFLARDVLRKLKIFFVLTLTLLLIPFFIITMARFSILEGGVGWWILNYGGQQLRNFNDHYLILEPLAYGRSGFPVFVDLFELVSFSEIQAFDKDVMFSHFLNNGVIPWVFTTFIGSIMLDFGKIWTFFFLCLFSLSARSILKTVSTKGVLKFSNMLILTLLYQVVYWGVFYFKQYATNYYMIFIILLSASFKVSNMKRFSAHFFKVHPTQLRRTEDTTWLNKVLRQIVQK
jgi:oligosaccharide repeat unit polymerase